MPETDHHNSSTAVDVDLRLRWAEEWLSQCPPGEFADVLQGTAPRFVAKEVRLV